MQTSDEINQMEHALVWAASKGFTSVVQLLLDAGASPNADGVLLAAAEHGHFCIVQLLLARGTNTFLEAALCIAVENGHLDAIKALLDGGADIAACNDFSIVWAAEKRFLMVVKLLIDRGAVVPQYYHDYLRS